MGIHQVDEVFPSCLLFESFKVDMHQIQTFLTIATVYFVIDLALIDEADQSADLLLLVAEPCLLRNGVETAFAKLGESSESSL